MLSDYSKNGVLSELFSKLVINSFINFNNRNYDGLKRLSFFESAMMVEKCIDDLQLPMRPLVDQRITIIQNYLFPPKNRSIMTINEISTPNVGK